jgi:FAD binding domain
VSYPETTAYNASISSYWSQQAESLSPSCIFSPTSAQDVSEAVAILSGLSVLGSSHKVGCQFAIRSGGHTPWAGASNINAGVTFDLSGLNQVTVSADQSYTSVGPGNRWVDVYLKLDALGLSVAGGRVSTVGVGGLVLGGECMLNF